jgi:hypothetical protein
MSRWSVGIHDKDIGRSSNLSTSARPSDLQVDVELKMKWTGKRSISSTNGLAPLWKNNLKSQYQSSLNPADQNLHIWSLAKCQRRQEQITVLVRLKNLQANMPKQKQNKAVVTQLPNESKKKQFSFYSRKSYSESVSLLQKPIACRKASYRERI